MTQLQFNQQYKNSFPNWKKETLTDRRLMYNDLMEQLRQQGQITEKQAANWGHPSFLKKYTNHISKN